MRRSAFVMVICACALPGAADEIDQDAVNARVRACFETGASIADKRLCMFKASEACQAEEEGGYSTLGMSMCNQAEAEAWDVLLNAEYKAAMAAGKVMDEDEAAHFPNLDKRVDTLRAAQRAWIAFRDAECLNAYASWGSGSMRHIAGTACMLEMTAERTIALWDKRTMFE